MGDQHRGQGSRHGDSLSDRRFQDDNDTFYETAVCPCELEEADPQSEYETSGEWVTYTGEVDLRIFEEAARHAEDDANSMIREAQLLYGSSAEAAPSAGALGAASMMNDESPPVDIDAPEEEESPEPHPEEEQMREMDRSRIPHLLAGDLGLPVDPIIDEWSVSLAAERAERAKAASKWTQEAAERAQQDAEAAREANLPNASQLAEMADNAIQIAATIAQFAKRAEERAKETSEALALVEAEMAMSKLTIATHEGSTHPVRAPFLLFFFSNKTLEPNQ